MTEQQPLERMILGKKAVDGILSGIAGLTLGIATGTAMGERGYKTPIGAAFVGLGYTLARKGNLQDGVVNVLSCEAGYYLGVLITQYFSR